MLIAKIAITDMDDSNRYDQHLLKCVPSEGYHPWNHSNRTLVDIEYHSVV